MSSSRSMARWGRAARGQLAANSRQALHRSHRQALRIATTAQSLSTRRQECRQERRPDGEKMDAAMNCSAARETGNKELSSTALTRELQSDRHHRAKRHGPQCWPGRFPVLDDLDDLLDEEPSVHRRRRHFRRYEAKRSGDLELANAGRPKNQRRRTLWQ